MNMVCNNNQIPDIIFFDLLFDLTPERTPTTMRTQDSGRARARQVMWWNMIFSTTADSSSPVNISGLENSAHL